MSVVTSSPKNNSSNNNINTDSKIKLNRFVNPKNYKIMFELCQIAAVVYEAGNAEVSSKSKKVEMKRVFNSSCFAHVVEERFKIKGAKDKGNVLDGSTIKKQLKDLPFLKEMVTVVKEGLSDNSHWILLWESFPDNISFD